ncbi:MAG: YifB family Mg chelatase-like AAA ATPase [Spirochaetia bacterium]
MSFAPEGFRGRIVTVEVDVRNGIPGTDIVGLAGAAVREARERVRAAIRNAGLRYPRDRVLINLGPADVPKAGNRFDLGIAAGILEVTGQGSLGVDQKVMALGELALDGTVRPAHGVISAVVAGKAMGLHAFVVPLENVREAEAVGGVRVCGLGQLSQWPLIGEQLASKHVSLCEENGFGVHVPKPDLSEMRGNARVKRSLEIASAGGHHLMLAGPPGSGKTMSAMVLPGLLPPLTRSHALEVTRIHSTAGEHECFQGLQWTPPFRNPHHSASVQGMVGGGREVRPGEISLAHRGILFLDELPEFRPGVLQALREPLESGYVRISRAGTLYTYPANFQLVVAANLCPCGNLGRNTGQCMCSLNEIQRYWRRVGRALLDRIDLRCPVHPLDSNAFLGRRGESSSEVRSRVYRAQQYRRSRREAEGAPNSVVREEAHSAAIPDLPAHCPDLSSEYLRRRLSDSARRVLSTVSEKLGMSGRAMDSVLRVARTICDLEGVEVVHRAAVLEAVQHRRLGERESVWQDWQSVEQE